MNNKALVMNETCEAYESGREDYRQGYSLKDCPHEEGTIDALNWRLGFLDEKD